MRQFKRIGLVVILAGLIGVGASDARAGEIVYNIMDQPAYEDGYTMSGTITTDGTLGLLKASEILSWSLTLTKGSFTQTITDMGQNVGAFGGYSSYNGLVATSTELIAPIPGTDGSSSALTGISLGSQLYPGTSDTAEGTAVSWAYYSFTPNTTFAAENPTIGYFWKNNGASLDSFNWVIGVAAVPEPSTILMLGTGAAMAAAFLAKGRKRSVLSSIPGRIV